MAEERRIIACMRLADLRVPKGEVRIDVCAECDAQIWVSDESDVIVGDDPRFVMICNQCVVKFLETAKLDGNFVMVKKAKDYKRPVW